MLYLSYTVNETQSKINNVFQKDLFIKMGIYGCFKNIGLLKLVKSVRLIEVEGILLFQHSLQLLLQACTQGLSEIRGAPDSKPGHMGLLHTGAVGNMEGIACSRIPSRISLLACWALIFSHALAGKEGDEMWILRVQAERCSVRGLLLAFTSPFWLCRSGQNWNLSFLHLQLPLERLIEELAEEWFRDTFWLVKLKKWKKWKAVVIVTSVNVFRFKTASCLGPNLYYCFLPNFSIVSSCSCCFFDGNDLC